MTCENCYHYDVCHKKEWYIQFGNIKDYEGIETECKYFKDKSLIVELPKTIWVISECLELEEYEVLGVFTTNNSIWLDTKGNKQQLLMQISNYNKIWFTDKSKVKAKLKELEE